jgi:hypothetical protein
MTNTWISTGKAAAILGCSRWTVLREFKARLNHRVLPSGHHRWIRAEVEKLAATLNKKW